MPIAYLAKRFPGIGILSLGFLLAALAHAQQPPTVAAGNQSLRLSSGATMTLSSMPDSSTTAIRIVTPGAAPRPRTAILKRDTDVAEGDALIRFEVVATIKDRAVVLIDAYRSKPSGLSSCQAGQERFLRVIALDGDALMETFRIKLESCRSNIELSSEGVRWHGPGSIVTIDWLMPPEKGQRPGARSYRIRDDGQVEPLAQRTP